MSWKMTVEGTHPRPTQIAISNRRNLYCLLSRPNHRPLQLIAQLGNLSRDRLVGGRAILNGDLCPKPSQCQTRISLFCSRRAPSPASDKSARSAARRPRCEHHRQPAHLPTVETLSSGWSHPEHGHHSGVFAHFWSASRLGQWPLGRRGTSWDRIVARRQRTYTKRAVARLRGICVRVSRGGGALRLSFRLLAPRCKMFLLHSDYLYYYGCRRGTVRGKARMRASDCSHTGRNIDPLASRREMSSRRTTARCARQRTFSVPQPLHARS